MECWAGEYRKAGTRGFLIDAVPRIGLEIAGKKSNSRSPNSLLRLRYSAWMFSSGVMAACAKML